MSTMTKQLLLQDLCSRLLCGVVCRINFTYSNETTFGEEVENEVDDTISMINTKRETVFADYLGCEFDIECVKPYLRSMDDMTEEERKEYKHLVAFSGNPDGAASFTDWLNKHHFDYRGLIWKGLALEALDEMYK